MTGTALTVVKAGAPLVAIDMSAINYDVAEKWLSTQGGNRTFAGEQLGFNGQEGFYKIGFGKNAQELDEVTLVVNVPYMAEAWQKWDGKAPEYPYIALPFAGQALPNRNTLGLDDQSQWQDAKFTPKGQVPKKVDPWKEVLVLVCRTEGGRLFHMLGASISMRNAILSLIRDAVVDGKRNHGKLPVVHFTSEKIKSDDGNYYVMKTEIVKWVKPEAIDNPGAQMVVSTDASPAADEGVEDAAPAVAKTVAKPRVAKEVKPAAPKPAVRMADPVSEDEHDEDGVLPEAEPEEVKPAPKRRSLS